MDCEECAPSFFGDQCEHQGLQAARDRWSAIRGNYENALAAYTPCRGFDCYNETLQTNLQPFARGGAISRKAFEIAMDYGRNGDGPGKGRMIHYQILGGKLYRSDRCPSASGRLSFHPRCEGIEGTLMQILDEDNLAVMGARRQKKEVKPPVSDTEFIVNINDKPQLQVARSKDIPVPLFSFSKPQGKDATVGGPFWDIMYPAWTFWGGGPFVSTEPNHGLGRWDKKLQVLQSRARQWPWDKKDARAFFRSGPARGG
jgi:protein glucosyltransferase